MSMRMGIGDGHGDRHGNGCRDAHGPMLEDGKGGSTYGVGHWDRSGGYGDGYGAVYRDGYRDENEGGNAIGIGVEMGMGMR